MRGVLEVRPEERVVLLLLDTPAFARAFFGAIKIGAVPIPTNSGSRLPVNPQRFARQGAVVSEALLPQIEGLTRARTGAQAHRRRRPARARQVLIDRSRS